MNPRSAETPPKTSVRTAFTEIIDYAGLFPPSQLAMSEAVTNFATYRNSNYNWMLGRFVLPVARLDEFYDFAEEFAPKGSEMPWRLSVLAGEDIYETIKAVKNFNLMRGPGFVCDALEVKANTVSKIENTVSYLPEDIEAYFEVARNNLLGDLVSALAFKKQRAKIRTGGVRGEDFPSSKEIIRFVRTCLAANVPFKATAGLHHPLHCFKPLTYAKDAPKGTMHGFMNVLLMTAFAGESYRVGLLEEIMEEEFEEVFAFEEGGVRWRDGYFISNSHLELVRERGMISFGSCSFDEPVEDLQALGLL
ncbi:MAG TPA: hypothetical protein VJL58_05905 [Pyrinomonadaceae bacterium]|nr:hypothetical protein [Pyrinomonadaceae bacterium]